MIESDFREIITNGSKPLFPDDIPADKEEVLILNCSGSGLSGDMFLACISGFLDSDLLTSAIKAVSSAFPGINITASFKNDIRGGKSVRLLDIAFFEDSGIADNGRLHKKEEGLATDDPKIFGAFPEDKYGYISGGAESHTHHVHHPLTVDRMLSIISELSAEFGLGDRAKRFAEDAFNIICEAEAEVHGTPRPKVHLHEVGSPDTVVDLFISGLYLDRLFYGDDRSIGIWITPPAVGGGRIKIAHGIVDVPAPATSVILKKYGIPYIYGPVMKELLTPTGAAIISSLKKNYGAIFITPFRSGISEELPHSYRIKKKVLAAGRLKLPEFDNILEAVLIGH